SPNKKITRSVIDRVIFLLSRVGVAKRRDASRSNVPFCLLPLRGSGCEQPELPDEVTCRGRTSMTRCGSLSETGGSLLPGDAGVRHLVASAVEGSHVQRIERDHFCHCEFG